MEEHIFERWQTQSSDQGAPDVTKEEWDFSKASVAKSSKKTPSIAGKLRTPITNQFKSWPFSPRKTFVHKGVGFNIGSLDCRRAERAKRTPKGL
jgi:hypothetical protein